MVEISAANVGSPLAAVRKAVEAGEEEIGILSADAVSSSEIMLFLEKSGFSVQLQDDDGRLILFYQGSPDGGKTWILSKAEIDFKGDGFRLIG